MVTPHGITGESEIDRERKVHERPTAARQSLPGGRKERPPERPCLPNARIFADRRDVVEDERTVETTRIGRQGRRDDQDGPDGSGGPVATLIEREGSHGAGRSSCNRARLSRASASFVTAPKHLHVVRQKIH